jgi:hypothetical protein
MVSKFMQHVGATLVSSVSVNLIQAFHQMTEFHDLPSANLPEMPPSSAEKRSLMSWAAHCKHMHF